MRALKRLNAWINDAALRDVDPRLNIVDIHEQPADTTLEWGSASGVSGQRLLHRTRQGKRIQIEFDIRELFDLAARAAIVTAANAWAADGVLKVSYRPRQALNVVLAEAASIEDARDVTAGFSITFQAGPDPYWRDEDATVYSYSGSSASGEIITVPGQAPVSPEITVTPSATLNTLSITIGGTTMAFASLNVAANTTLTIAHDERGFLTVKAGTTSVLNKRTAASVDDFLLKPGKRGLSYTADASCAMNVRFRGRYL